MNDLITENEQNAIDNYLNLGWQQWSGNNDKIKTCVGQGHKIEEVSHSRRGSDHTLWCDKCKIVWKIDSSD